MTNKEAIVYLEGQLDCMCSEDCRIYTGHKDCPQGFICNDGQALLTAISALQEKDSLIARLKAEAIKRNVQYMKSGDRYLIGFVDGMRLARSIVDGSIDEPKYVYPSEGTSDGESGCD